jgi:hypothetical protein
MIDPLDAVFSNWMHAFHVFMGEFLRGFQEQPGSVK